MQIVPAPSSLFSAANKQIQQNSLVQLSNILVNNPIVNQQEFLKRVFEAFDFSNPDALLATQQVETATPTPEPSTEGKEPIPTETGMEDLTNANVAAEDMAQSDAEFLQQISM